MLCCAVLCCAVLLLSAESELDALTPKLVHHFLARLPSLTHKVECRRSN